MKDMSFCRDASHNQECDQCKLLHIMLIRVYLFASPDPDKPDRLPQAVYLCKPCFNLL